MVAIAAATLLLAIVRLLIGRDALKKSDPAERQLCGVFRQIRCNRLKKFRNGLVIPQTLPKCKQTRCIMVNETLLLNLLFNRPASLFPATKTFFQVGRLKTHVL